MKESDSERHSRQYAELIAKIWSDSEFKARFKKDPKAAMKELGINAVKGIEIEVLESSPTKSYFVIPPEPDVEIKDLDLTAYSSHFNINGSG